jgi:hypothetical protein
MMRENPPRDESVLGLKDAGSVQLEIVVVAAMLDCDVVP